MSFPSALVRLKAGDSPDAALLYAMEHDTSLGYTALMATAKAARASLGGCPCCITKEALPNEHRKDVLRHERRGKGVVVDFNPDSVVGKQIARLLGTDAARPLIEGRAGVKFGFANCCRVLASVNVVDVRFSVEEQIRWQANIDC